MKLPEMKDGQTNEEYIDSLEAKGISEDDIYDGLLDALLEDSTEVTDGFGFLAEESDDEDLDIDEDSSDNKKDD